LTQYLALAVRRGRDGGVTREEKGKGVVNEQAKTK
jgi:hypothetical protein